MKPQHKQTLNLALGFVISVSAITVLSGVLSFLIGLILHLTGALSIVKSPIILMLLFIGSTTFICTLEAVVISKRSYRSISSLLDSVSEIGKGNFDIEIDIPEQPENIHTIAANIQIMAEELKNLEILRNDFIQNFSHEFKTPVVSIQGFARRLLNRDLDETQQREYLEIILEESTRLAALANNTLNMSKLDSMDRVPVCRDFSLDEQLRQCVLLTEKQWSAKRIDVELDLGEIPYTGDEELIKQIWVNLIGNAIKFTPEEGRIIVTAASGEHGVTVKIADTGIGMDEETTSRAFDKYFQADSSRATEGNGLGLSIVKRITGIIGGSVDVRSTLGAGSTFTVTLPKV